MNSRATVAAIILALSGCQDTATPPPEPATVPTTPRVAPKPGKLAAIDLPTLFPLQQSGATRIYDVRPKFIAGFGTIPGAISWPLGEFDVRLPEREPEIRAAAAAGTPIVLYCTDSACPDARAMGERLAALGHDVAILEGGFAAWKEAGLPTE